MNQNLQYLQNITDGLSYIKVPSLLPVACLTVLCLILNSVFSFRVTDVRDLLN